MQDASEPRAPTVSSAVSTDSHAVAVDPDEEM
jgi:hypothetical protein